MHSLKKKVKNKAQVEGSIMEAYTIEKNLNFNRYYFNLSVQSKLTQVDRNDDGGAEGLEWKILIFAYPAWEFRHEVCQIFFDTKLWQVKTYVLLNYLEINPYVL